MTNRPEFHQFESMEEAVEFIRKGDDFGNRNLHDKQKAVTFSDYWIRFYNLENRLIIFGYVEPLSYWDREDRGVHHPRGAGGSGSTRS